MQHIGTRLTRKHERILDLNLTSTIPIFNSRSHKKYWIKTNSQEMRFDKIESKYPLSHFQIHLQYLDIR